MILRRGGIRPPAWPGITVEPGVRRKTEEEHAEKIKKIKRKKDYRQVVRDYAHEDLSHTAELVRKWLKERR